MNRFRMEFIWCLFFLCSCFVLADEGAELPFNGYYRFGAWSRYVPPDDGFNRTLETDGDYTITGEGPLLFKPGIAGANGAIITFDGEVQSILKGYHRLQPEERLTLWYGFNPPSVPILLKDAGEFSFVILHSEPGSSTPVLENLDIIVLEKYPSFLHAQETADAVTEWLAGGGTVVLTGRGLLYPRSGSIFTPFINAESGEKVVSHIRSKWKGGDSFAVDEFYTIPAGLGRIIVFPADRKFTGPAADMTLRENAWNAIGFASGRPDFPDRFGAQRLDENTEHLLPVESDDFAVPGAGFILFFFCAGIFWSVFVSARKGRMFIVLTLVTSLLLFIFYRNADYTVSALSVYRTVSGSDVVREYSFIRVVPFRDHTIEFTSGVSTPYIQLSEVPLDVAVTETPSYIHSTELKAGQTVLFYRSLTLTDLKEQPVTWFFKGGQLSVFLQQGIKPERLLLFSRGKLYTVDAPSSGTGLIDENRLIPVSSPDTEVRTILETVRMISDPGQRFMILQTKGGVPQVDFAGGRKRYLRHRMVFIIGEQK